MKILRKILSPKYDAYECERLLPISTADWQKIIEFSSRALVLPALYPTIKLKSLDKFIQPQILSTLKFFFDFNVRRNAGIREQIIDVTTALNKQGIIPVWLKGATILLDDDWRSSGRMMVDLDLWIPHEAEQSKSLEALNAMGYQPVPLDLENYPDLDNHNHFIPMQRIGKIAPLEVHKHPLSNHYQNLLSNQEILLKVQWLEWNGLKLGVLSKPHQMIQSLVQCLEEGRFFWIRVENSCLMKVLDLHRRLLALDSSQREVYLTMLSEKLMTNEKSHFFSMLKRDFGFNSALSGSLLGLAIQERFHSLFYFPCKRFQRKYPKTTYFLFMCKAAFFSIKSYGVKRAYSWPKKLRGHIQKMNSLR